MQRKINLNLKPGIAPSGAEMRAFPIKSESTRENLAVIFDVDGVLIDSYEAHWKSWQALASETGVQFLQRDFNSTFGRTSRDTIRAYWPNAKSEQSVYSLDDRKEELFREHIEAHFPQMDGAIELIDALHSAGFAIAAGSSGPPENVHLVLHRLGRESLFEAVITGRDVTHGKPDPEVFLVAAKRLNIPPAKCVVIEDAPSGIEAAHAAGMFAIALVSTGRTVADFVGCLPDMIIASLRHLSPGQIAEALRAQSAPNAHRERQS